MIAAIGCGGTISSIGRDSTDVLDYPDFGNKLPIEEVIGRVDEVTSIAEVLPVPYRSVGSTAIGPPEWLELAATIHRLAAERPEIAGFVLPHGTATLEETAYFLNLVLKTEKTVVLVGAMRPSSAISADGHLNVVSAVRVAANSQSLGRGCLVVMNDTIFNARDVTKNSTYRIEAFESRDLGPLGFADADGKVVYYHQPTRKHTTQTEFDVRTMPSLP